MGFHKRHITNEQVIDTYNKYGIDAIWNLYTKGVDAIITEMGIASTLSDILHDPEWQPFGRPKMQKHMILHLEKEPGVTVQQIKD